MSWKLARGGTRVTHTSATGRACHTIPHLPSVYMDGSPVHMAWLHLMCGPTMARAFLRMSSPRSEVCCADAPSVPRTCRVRTCRNAQPSGKQPATDKTQSVEAQTHTQCDKRVNGNRYMSTHEGLCSDVPEGGRRVRVGATRAAACCGVLRASAPVPSWTLS